jgi:hypothetical protein
MDLLLVERISVQDEIKNHNDRITCMRSYLQLDDEIICEEERQDLRDNINNLIHLINQENDRLCKINEKIIKYRNIYGIPG